MISRMFENVTDDDISNLIQQGEGAQIEFKRDVINILDLAKLVSAFANTDGGVAIFGVEEPDKIVGCSLRRTQDLVGKIENRIRPVPEMRLHVQSYRGVELAILVVKRLQSGLAISDAGAFVREGEATRLIDASTIERRIPVNEPVETTNQHLREMLELMNDRIASLQVEVAYPRTWRGRAIALVVAFTAGFFARLAAGWVADLFQGKDA
ncbi:Divergent AAA domain protein [Symmachiella dynata]|uniref:Divergent AAA domain protein n=1 Tax=Symmachiella dynata TaxID=2527995 RepID=A0A517ZQ53_9PLAN|nr:RNA-binding domain-containing protein [Symmachiella dynata]QDT47225.1 Divergent AAA domain protein [Symmachiella dynata]QDU44580.1 Divergent AAA domain protein [Symmachiella dynata]